MSGLRPLSTHRTLAEIAHDEILKRRAANAFQNPPPKGGLHPQCVTCDHKDAVEPEPTNGLLGGRKKPQQWDEGLYKREIEVLKLQLKDARETLSDENDKFAELQAKYNKLQGLFEARDRDYDNALAEVRKSFDEIRALKNEVSRLRDADLARGLPMPKTWAGSKTPLDELEQLPALESKQAQ